MTTYFLVLPLYICSVAVNLATNCLLCVIFTISLLLSLIVKVVTNPLESNNINLLPSNDIATILFCNKISCKQFILSFCGIYEI